MLSPRFAHCPRAVASSSSAPIATARCLHSSASLQISEFRRRKSRISEKANVDKRAERERQAALNRPHPVLGSRPGDELKWKTCDLAKVLVTQEDILKTPIPQIIPGSTDVSLPSLMNYGIGQKEKEMLFETLPALTAEASLKKDERSIPEHLNEAGSAAEYQEARKASLLGSLVDLRNANARGIAYENRRRIIAEFSLNEKPNDTGRPEVQAAILTMQIRNLWEHLNRVKKDISNRRSLRRLVHQRAKILKYLKRVDRDRYDVILGRLGLEPESVEGELVV